MNSNNTEEQIEITDKVKKSFGYVTAVSVLLIILGIVAIYYPEKSGEVSIIAMGVFLIIAGILRLIFSGLSASMGSLLMKVIFSLVTIFAGVWVLLNPIMGVIGLTMVLAVYLLIDGLVTLIFSFQLTPMRGGAYLLIDAIISIVIGGFILYKWPETGEYALGTYLGLKIIIDGLMLLLTGQVIKNFLSN